MSEESPQTQDKQLQQAIGNELSANGDLLPPWLKHPNIPRYSIGWRMGYGEYYLVMWHAWTQHFTQTQFLEYFQKYMPIPMEWLDWVAYCFGHDNLLNDMLTGTGEFVGIHWLEEQHLGSFAEFKAWYDEQWLKSDSED